MIVMVAGSRCSLLDGRLVFWWWHHATPGIAQNFDTRLFVSRWQQQRHLDGFDPLRYGTVLNSGYLWISSIKDTKLHHFGRSLTVPSWWSLCKGCFGQWFGSV
ncbi:hypothetical protein M0R45_017355 [Rubus argutus]|uniref:Secreted protein n=1 Tax=Rubus argutus TaxID=59490 RepID=A0AAW1XXQ6_RUBAR